nr:hypothetical protein [Thiocapsa sp. KS1]
MARRKKSGFFETAVKSLFGFGTTVHYKTDWLGRKQKVVRHHDSGKTKTYTHGNGLFGNTTTTRTTKGWATIERGTVRKNIFFNGATEHAIKSDGTHVTRSYKSGLLGSHVITTQNGVCFKCDGKGKVVLSCKICNGTGMCVRKEQTCLTCNGTGNFGGGICKKCSGTGIYKIAATVPCKKCEGSGAFEVTCNRCDGTGRFVKKTYK